MIARLIHWCVGNRAIVLLLTFALIAAGVWAALRIKVDAIPDLSDVQVIIRTEFAGQAPQIVEQQVTYQLTTAMLQVPQAATVRGYSMFGTSFVYVIFDDGTDVYWARSRVLEQLSFVAGRLPEGVTPQLGPDATGVGWIYQYVLDTGPFCPNHPQGLWHDRTTSRWYEHDPGAKGAVHHRIFPGRDTCPLDAAPLSPSDTDLAQLRSLQDWYLRYELTALPGVSEVAAIGGFVKQYQVTVDPVKLQGFDLSLAQVREAIARSNTDTGGSVIERSETEYIVRGRGYLGTPPPPPAPDAPSTATPDGPRTITARVLDDLGQIVITLGSGGIPVTLGDVATITTGPRPRRGVAEWNGQGETVGGIVVMRSGDNARATIDRVRDRLAQLQRGLPPGVAIRVAYDRSDLIDRAVATLSDTLVEEIIVVALVCILFLLHARSELVAVFVVPTGVLTSILIMHLLDMSANIMSLGGIAIAIGVMVDSSIVMVENAHKHLDREEERQKEGGKEAMTPRPHRQIIQEAAAEVGPSLFFSLLVIVVSFLPVFVLEGQSGRLFKPLAYTKTFAMAAAALLAVTVIPVLMSYFITARVLPRSWGRAQSTLVTLTAMIVPALALYLLPLGPLDPYRAAMTIGWLIVAAMLLIPQRIIHENRNPISRLLQWLYHPFFVLVMHFRWPTLIAAILLIAATWFPFQKLGSEFMPPLTEGDLLYMPTTDPGISVAKARELLGQTDALIMAMPEVQSVMGKIGRADTATDPAPPSMLETTITLHRDLRKWRHIPVKRFYSNWPDWLARIPRAIWPDVRPITVDELIYGFHLPDGDFIPGLNTVVQIPGLTNAWTMPIRTRIDMLSTGIKTPVGIKVMGPDLATLAALTEDIAGALTASAEVGSYTLSAFPEKTVGGHYLDIHIDRDAIARHGLAIDAVQAVIATAVGGMEITTTVEGIERYPVNLRYPREIRDTPEAIAAVLVDTPGGARIPLAQLAEIRLVSGPPMIKSEGARPTSWVFVDIAGVDVGTYVSLARHVVAEAVTLPAGYTLVWSGQYEYMQQARARLIVAVPLALVVIILLLYLATHSWLRVGIVLLAVPFSLVGAIWLLYLLDYNLSLAVWIGIIALAGLDAETGLVMLLYLDNSYDRFANEGRMRDRHDLWHAVHDGAVQRIRPKTMTVLTTFIGLVPLLVADGAGADTMRRLAAPMVGGLATSFLLELLIYPVIYYMAKSLGLPHRHQ